MKLGSNRWDMPDNKVSDQFYRFSESYTESSILGLYDEKLRCNPLRSDNRAGLIAQKIQEAIDASKPFSMVRVSDGEGNVLFDYKNLDNLHEYILEQISYLHFGDRRVVPDNAKAFKDLIEKAIASADVVCVPECDALKRGFNTPEEDIDVRAVIGNRISALRVSEIINDNQLTASAWSNRQLLGYYKKLFSGVKSLGVISSYPELKSILASKFGIEEIVHHSIPRQALFLKHDERKNSGHYPDVFQSIVNSINPKYPGMPYIVSAGLLGKFYCHVIKSRGGIAIDTGTVPEIWLGIPNRGLSPEFIDKWKLV